MSVITWTLLSPKGGAGKTTLTLVLAGEIARRGKRVALIDADPNTPLVRWLQKDCGPELITVIEDGNEDGSTIADTIEKAQEIADFVIVDTEGTNNLRANNACSFSDMVIVPVQSSTDDMLEGIKGIEFVNQASRMARREIPSLIVRTIIDPAITDREEKVVASALKTLGHNVCDTKLMRRSAYKTLKTLGTTLYTFEKDEAAGLEKAKLNSSNVFEAIFEDFQALVATAVNANPVNRKRVGA